MPKFFIFLFMCEMVCCYQTCYKRSCVRGRSYAHNRTLSFKVLLSYADKRYVMGNIASRPCHFMFKAIFCFKKLTFGNFSCAWIVGCTLPCRLFCNGVFLQNPYQTGPKVNENELLKHAGASQKDSSYLLSMTFFLAYCEARLCTHRHTKGLHVMMVPFVWPLSSVNTLSYSLQRPACSFHSCCSCCPHGIIIPCRPDQFNFTCM